MIDNTRFSIWMDDNKISNTELAGILKLSQSAVSQIRSGKNQLSHKALTRLLEHYPDLSFRWLLLGEGQASLKGTITASERSRDDRLTQENQMLKELLKSKDETIKAKDELIELLRGSNR